jgi:hypothetical protein
MIEVLPHLGSLGFVECPRSGSPNPCGTRSPRSARTAGRCSLSGHSARTAGHGRGRKSCAGADPSSNTQHGCCGKSVRMCTCSVTACALLCIRLRFVIFDFEN